MEIKERCISKKEYLKRNNSDVGYALYVQNNIKKDDYARLNTGEIVRVTGIRENQVNKKAIYFGIYDDDWCDSAAVENFSENIIDLIEVGDIVNNGYIYEIGNTEGGHKWVYNLNGLLLFEKDIETILTKEQIKANCYKVKGE